MPRGRAKDGFTGSWRKYTQRITSDRIIRANYTPIGIIDPIQPSVIDSEPTEEPWEPIEPGTDEVPEVSAQESSFFPSDWVLASSETYTHEYLTQSGKVARETIRQSVGGTVLSTKTLDFFYDESGRPFALNYSVDGCTAETYYYILNLQGDVIKLIQPDGTVAAEYSYDAWGKVLSAEGELAEINPLRYRGYYYDSETGFYYLQSRYYDPENHRFINADVYTSTDSGDAISCNMFAYCGNNPVVRSDEDGELWDWVVRTVVGAAVGAIVGLVSATVTGGNVKDVIIGTAAGFVGGAVIGATGRLSAGVKAWRAVGSACNAIGTFISVKMDGGSTGAALAGAGLSFSTTYLAASIPNGTLLADGLVSATFGAGASLCTSAICAGVVKKQLEAAQSAQNESNQTSIRINSSTAGNSITQAGNMRPYRSFIAAYSY